MHRIVRRKLLGVRKNVEYNEKDQPHGKAAKEMQSYIGVLARTKIPITIPSWKKVDMEMKNKLWESVELAFVLGPERKKMVLASAACKWREFKSRLMSQYILPFKDDVELLQTPPEEYNFIELADWKSFILHNEQSERRAMCEYPHRMSRLGYAGLEDELLKTMDPKDIDRATLWKKAREDKSGNILDEKVKQKGNRIDELSKQVKDGTLKVEALNSNSQPTPNIVGNASEKASYSTSKGISMKDEERQFFNVHEEDNGEGKYKDSKNPRKRKYNDEKLNEVPELDFHGMPKSLKLLCRYAQSMIKMDGKCITFEMEEEVFGSPRTTHILNEDILQLGGMEKLSATCIVIYMRYLYNVLQDSDKLGFVIFVDPAIISAPWCGTSFVRSRTLADRFKGAHNDQMFFIPYNSGDHWMLTVVHPAKEIIYHVDSVYRSIMMDDEWKHIVNDAIGIYNRQRSKQGRKNPVWKIMMGAPKQPTNKECGYYVMRFMRDLINDDIERQLAKWEKMNETTYKQEEIDEVHNEWAEFVTDEYL
ncbi:hypothetical protein M0R45_015879 [Rubus argutus]|uniref:Ubiquitin-like protease family profile domain-containing protein n=1 Tax=Rubus argutus TaxID=59490 RepID=A0AAW1XRD7_RUBAR